MISLASRLQEQNALANRVPFLREYLHQGGDRVTTSSAPNATSRTAKVLSSLFRLDGPLLYLFLGAMLNWPVSWAWLSTGFFKGGGPMHPVPNQLHLQSSWPAGVPQTWPPLSKFITSERVAIDQQLYAGKITPQDAENALKDQPFDCILKRYDSLLNAYVEYDATDRATGIHYRVTESIAGFPFHSMIDMVAWEDDGTGKPAVASRGVREWRFRGHSFPLRAPHLPGFALNSIVYGVIVWVCTIPIRRFIRKHRWGPGQCKSCGYELSPDMQMCPECGVKPAPATA
jgi:hypothetical protein